MKGTKTLHLPPPLKNFIKNCETDFFPARMYSSSSSAVGLCPCVGALVRQCWPRGKTLPHHELLNSPFAALSLSSSCLPISFFNTPPKMLTFLHSFTSLHSSLSQPPARLPDSGSWEGRVSKAIITYYNWSDQECHLLICFCIIDCIFSNGPPQSSF